MIDHDKKIVFIHVPKTGGSSIANVMRSTEDDPDGLCYPPITMKEPLRTTGVETTFHTSNKYMGYPEYQVPQLEGYHYFTIFRHPYERALSMFYWKYPDRDHTVNKYLFHELIFETKHLYGTQVDILKKYPGITVYRSFEEAKKYIQGIYKKPVFHSHQGNYPNKTLLVEQKDLINILYKDEFKLIYNN